VHFIFENSSENRISDAENRRLLRCLHTQPTDEAGFHSPDHTYLAIFSLDSPSSRAGTMNSRYFQYRKQVAYTFMALLAGSASLRSYVSQTHVCGGLRRRTGAHQTTQAVMTSDSDYGIYSRHKLVKSSKTVPLKQRQGGEFRLNTRFARVPAHGRRASQLAYSVLFLSSWVCAIDNRIDLPG